MRRWQVAVAAFVVLPPVAASGQSVKLPGTVRDFKQNHPDFDLVEAPAHYVHNVMPMLSADDRPIFAGGGFELSDQFRDAGGQELSPQVYLYGGGVVRIAGVADPAELLGTLDSYSPALGPYGGGNVGPAPAIRSGEPMPVYTPPSVLPPSSGDLVYSGGSATLSGVINCDSLRVEGDALVRIDGPTTIVCADEFKVAGTARVELMPESTLRIFILAADPGVARFRLQDFATVNMNTAEHWRVTIFNLGTETFRIRDEGRMYATLVSPQAAFRVHDLAEFFGVYMGRSLIVENTAFFHHVNGAPCVVPAGDQPGTFSADSNGLITSADTFGGWFRDRMGTNMSLVHPITLTLNGATGLYECFEANFFPIDGKLYGNQGDIHNYFFTYELEADFVYRACRGQFLALKTDDDGWLALDDRVIMDLNGLGPKGHLVELDRLDLVDGEIYRFRMFMAQRDRDFSSLEVLTNIKLSPVDRLAISAPVD